VTIGAPAPPSPPDTQRCSLWVRSHGLSPAGTAGTPGGFLLVDWPLPWPGDLGDIAELAVVRQLAAARGLRVQLTVPIADRPARVALYEPPAGDSGFAGYAGTERDAAGPGGAELAAAATALLAAEGEPGTRPVPDGEILICTHGRRDACCGQFGTTLVMELTGSGHVRGGRALAAEAAAAGRPVRRTSHTGGHRFAPSMIVLPEGSVWGFADRDLVHGVAARTGSAVEAAAHYRGCTGLSSSQLQALEGAVLAEVGWELFAGRRIGQAVGADRYRLTVTGPAGDVSEWEAAVGIGRRVTLPECGAPVSEPLGGKPTFEWQVHDLARVG
jgi:hypothetical protein